MPALAGYGAGQGTLRDHFLDQAVAAVVEKFIGQRLSQKLATDTDYTQLCQLHCTGISAVEAV